MQADGAASSVSALTWPHFSPTETSPRSLTPGQSCSSSAVSWVHSCKGYGAGEGRTAVSPARPEADGQHIQQPCAGACTSHSHQRHPCLRHRQQPRVAHTRAAEEAETAEAGAVLGYRSQAAISDVF